MRACVVLCVIEHWMVIAISDVVLLFTCAALMVLTMVSSLNFYF